MHRTHHQLRLPHQRRAVLCCDLRLQPQHKSSNPVAVGHPLHALSSALYHPMLLRYVS